MWISLIIRSLFITKSYSSSCSRRTFHLRLPEHVSPGTVLTSYPSLSRALCERTCRQYLKCTAYRVQYTTESTGKCDLLFGINLTSIGRSISGSDELYATCPDNMAFNNLRKACIHIVKTPMMYEGAVAFCRAFHPQAHLPEIFTKQDEDHIIDIADDYNINNTFLYAKKVSGKDKFEWVHSAQEVQYFSWGNNEPSGLYPGEACLMLTKEYDNGPYKWHDVPCDWPSYSLTFICEF